VLRGAVRGRAGRTMPQYTYALESSDVVLGLGPWSLAVLKDKVSVLGPGLGFEPRVLGPVLGLETTVLVNITHFCAHFFNGTCRWLSAYDAAFSLEHFSYTFTYLVH